ncbi:MAG: hypothetical protein ISN28_02745 [Ectothiorhodospiraceae bacterium AqS1]|nr:hypothetical protein [Ectothiorhodospiraceae bacterium AqS1]
MATRTAKKPALRIFSYVLRLLKSLSSKARGGIRSVFGGESIARPLKACRITA